MKDEYILKIFWKREKEHEDERTRTIKRNFGVDINSQVRHLMEIIENLLDASKIINETNYPHMMFNNITFAIDKQTKLAEKELEEK